MREVFDHVIEGSMNLEIPLTGFKPGDDLTIMNTMQSRYFDDNGKYHELLTLVFKDNKTGLKHKEEIIDPLYEFYTVDKENHTDWNRLFVEQEKTEAHVAPHKSIARYVADSVGLGRWYRQTMEAGNKNDARQIHTHPDVFMSDQNLEDHYRFWFDRNFTNEQCSISKSYFDIEVDGIHMRGDFPEMGECPVNAITVFFQDKMQAYTLLLRSSENELIPAFEKFITEHGTQDLHDFICNYVTSQRAGKKNASLNTENIKYSIAFFDEDKEIDLISTFFKLINTYNPDFAMAWNQAFDIPYLIARCERLGYDPAQVMSHPDFTYKQAEYFIDERALNEPAERCDVCTISAYTTYLDQMIQFASRRKGQTQFPSMKLDDIGEVIAGVHKLDYKEITTNITLLPYKDYKTFVYYNVMDVIVQYCIESTVEDIDFVFGKALVNNTRYPKVHRQTVYLANRAAKEFRKGGFIIGNNNNRTNSKPTEKFPGVKCS